MVIVELDKFANKLLKSGFRVFRHDKGSSWLIFGKGNNVGNVEYIGFRGWNFITTHRPNRLTGTGFQVRSEILNPTIDDAYSTFIIAPTWASENDISSVEKYKNIDDYVKKSYLDYTELKKNRIKKLKSKKPVKVRSHKKKGTRGVRKYKRRKPLGRRKSLRN